MPPSGPGQPPSGGGPNTPPEAPIGIAGAQLTASGGGVAGSSSVTGMPAGGEFSGVQRAVQVNPQADTVPPAELDIAVAGDDGGVMRPAIDMPLTQRDGDFVPELIAGQRTYRTDSAGYTTSLHPALGRVIMWRTVDGRMQQSSSCSGTVVARTMVLTAAHCLTDKSGRGWDGYTFVPGLVGTNTPAGQWVTAGNRAWLPTYYGELADTAAGTLFDYALIKFDPQFNGNRYLADYTGAFTVYMGASSVATKLMIGYPVEGAFNVNNGGYCQSGGLFCYPYLCQSSDGQNADFGNGWLAMGFGCHGNGGDSGAGVFGQIGGTWYVISVVSVGGDMRDPNGNLCTVRLDCNWYMRNTWGPVFQSGYFDAFYRAAAAL